MSSRKSNVASEESSRERLARYQGAGSAGLLVAGLLVSIGAYLHQDNASAREELKLAHEERVSDMKGRLEFFQAEVVRLRDELKDARLKAQVADAERASALDPGKLCGALLSVVQQKQQIVVDKESKIPYDAPRVSPIRAISAGEVNPEMREHRNYQAMLDSVQASKVELQRAEAELTACLRGTYGKQ